jgi:trimeric autotransporter adhesin
MPTTSRVASARFTPFLLAACLFGLGCFDTARAQTLTVSATTLTFSTSPGSNPPAQTVTTGSTGGSFNFSIATTVNWLSVGTGALSGPTGTTGQTLEIQATASGMASGTYASAITLTPNNGSPAVVINVTLTISGSGNSGNVLTPSLPSLYFGIEIGKPAPPAEQFQVTSTGVALPISFALAEVPSPTCPLGWLQATASASTTPVTFTASVVTTGLGPGTCSGNITVTSTSNGTATTVIPVTVFISQGPVLNVVIPLGLTSVTLKQGGDPMTFQGSNGVQITSSDPTVALSFSASATIAPWLAAPSCEPAGCQTPNSLYIEIIPGSQTAAGTYIGSITITSSSLFNGTLTIPITFTLLPAGSVSVSPSGSQSFTESQGGALPPSQTLTLTGSASATYTTAITQVTGGAWLQASPTSGSVLPNSSGSVITLSVAPNTLAQGNYSSQLTITFVPSTIPAITVLVSLTVGPPSAGLVATPSSLSFSYQSGGATPAAQTVTVSNPAVNPSIAYTVGSISQSWISVSPNTGTTPGSVVVSITPQGLQPGMYSGTFTLASTNAALSLTVPVSLMISGNTTPQVFLLGNNSSGVGGQVAPGEIILIEGSGLGPASGVTGISTLLQNVQVTFNSVPGTLLYVSASQIDVIVPYEVAGKTSTTMVVNYLGVPSSNITIPVFSVALGISTLNEGGTGQAAALNPNYSINGPSNPVLEGSYISLYGTGGGQTNPASLDGEISSLTTLLPLALEANVTATIGGKNAPVLFAGAAPGLITGVTQIDLQVPVGVTGPALPVVITITIGSTVIQSQAGVTVAVQ